ncbi:MAG: 4Fe-4S binding protein [Bacteriovoracaceae bacterium]
MSVCAGCQNCVSVCPHDIWATSQDEKYRTIIVAENVSKCQMDMECMEVCPTGAIEIIPNFG